MHAPRLLVIEGNTAETRRRQADRGERPYGESYSDTLRAVASDAVVDICYPTDSDANIPDTGGLSGYDGVVITGSALNIYKAEPEALRQVELAREVFKAGVPFFGSCWGLQVATVAAGGTVRKSDKGRELGFARKITLTEAGRNHPMHLGKGLAFDAPAVHTDEVESQPSGMIVTASNTFSKVQAAEIRHANGVFWGVQYHPEFGLSDIAAIIARYGDVLIEQDPLRFRDDIDRYVSDLRALDRQPDRTDIGWRLGIDADILEPKRRLTEIRNWMEYMVRPWISGRGRR